jgi:hypothetical protein
VMGALHDASAAYWAANADGTCAVTAALLGGGAINNMDCGYPGDKFGWAAGVGAVLNLPFIAKGDRFAFQVNTSEGATRYVNNNGDAIWYGGQYSIANAWNNDAILRNTIVGVQQGSVELTKAWGFIAAFEHYWTPALKTSFYGGGYQIDYNSNATAYICNVTTLAFTNTGTGATRNSPLCNPDSGVWYLGTRTQWNIRPDFYMGVDLIYEKLDTAMGGGYASLAANGARPATTSSGIWYKYEDQDTLALRFRVQRDIVP